MIDDLNNSAARVDHLVELGGEDTALLRAAFGRFPSGVAAICAQDSVGETAIFIASSFQTGISLEPPLALFAVKHSSTSWPRLLEAERLGISILAADHARVAWQLASGRPDRFNGTRIVTASSGANFLRGASAWMEASVFSVVEAGDHDVVLLRIHSVANFAANEPLVWHDSIFRTLAQRAL